MAKQKGSDILLYVYNGSTYTKVGGQIDMSISRTANTIDITDKDDEDMKYDYGKRDSTLTLDHCVLDSDSGYAYLQSAYDNKTAITVRHYINGTAVKSASAIVTSLDVQAPDGDKYTGSVALQITGGWSAV